MNTLQETRPWKRVLKWLATTLVVVVVLDWLFDGRLREQLPFRRKAHQNRPPNV